MGCRSHEVALFDANDEKVAVGMPVAEAASQVLYGFVTKASGS